MRPPYALAAAGLGFAPMRRDLTPAELRVLGCLIEKQRTTPDQYPLSLNSLRLACNQATNREPVVDYDEAVVREALGALGRRHWIRSASGHGSRALKYRHLLRDELPLPDGEESILAVLMLRGAQTPGQLKQRTERMHGFEDLGAVAEAIESLIGRDLVVRLPRAPGQKEERFEHLLSADAEEGGGELVAEPAVAAASGSSLEERVAELELALAEVRAELARLREG
jgi:uncharacterized protein YceH (UPF0502 family)